MASTINASTSPTTGIITTADSSGNLELQNNGTTALSLQSGKVINPSVTNYTETAYTANTSTAITVSLSNGTVQILT